MIKQSWLIQRLLAPSKTDNPFSFGGGYKNGGLTEETMALLRPIFSFDYMGAAEFEFGRLPTALEKIWNHMNLLVKESITTKEGQYVYYIAPVFMHEYIEKFIHHLLDGGDIDLRLKEPPMLLGALAKKNHYKGWLELDNGFFFFVDKDMFEKTCTLFKVGDNHGN
jgi:hypothetical protein